MAQVSKSSYVQLSTICIFHVWVVWSVKSVGSMWYNIHPCQHVYVKCIYTGQLLSLRWRLKTAFLVPKSIFHLSSIWLSLSLPSCLKIVCGKRASLKLLLLLNCRQKSWCLTFDSDVISFDIMMLTKNSLRARNLLRCLDTNDHLFK